MNKKNLHTIFNYIIAGVWLINGLFCKVLNLVPRHEQIVSTILGSSYSTLLTTLIGFSEIVMAVWILSKIKTRINAIAQIVIVISMNIIEFSLAPNLLLWGKFNLIFAMLFVTIVYLNEFKLNQNPN